MKNHWIIYLFIICHICGLIYGDAELPPSYASQLNHPDKRGYQSVVLGTDKHRYGYQLQASGKHFHHTSTEKDGVRLGCYGYELDGKEYITQYVADSRGYRLVTTEDLITVYPKYGAQEAKASFSRPFSVDEDTPRNVRYFFPKGCKGIDVQIDNSSRLRSLKNFDVSAKLPVTYKPVVPEAYIYNTPPPNLPGPPNIYAPIIPVQTARPPNAIYSPQKPPNTYLPPEKPTNTYLPPENPTNTYLPPEVPVDITSERPDLVTDDPYTPDPLPEEIDNENEPDNTYVPPNEPDNTYLPPEEPDNTYLPPEEPDNTYLPPKEPDNTYLPPEEPDNTYLPPEEPDNTYLPPKEPDNTYLPPETSNTTHSPEDLGLSILPPYCPPDDSACCKDSLGKIVIPIKLKGQKSNNCCSYAKLILPLKFFEGLDFKKFKESLPANMDTNIIVQRILENLL